MVDGRIIWAPKKRNHNNEGAAIGIYMECYCMPQKSRDPGNSKFSGLSFFLAFAFVGLIAVMIGNRACRLDE
jgi:hypothetical protein